MSRVGRKPEKLVLAWKLLRRNKVAQPDGTWRVDSPTSLLYGAMSYQYICRMLTKLEDAGYIRKMTLGGIRIEYVTILKDVEELEEDVLGSSQKRPARVAPARPPRVPMSAVSAPAPVQEPAKAVAQPQRCVAIFVDWDNIVIPLEAAGSEFPAEGLLEYARKKGPVLEPYQVFAPMHIEREKLVALRQAGWTTIVCPPVKPGGGDTVDKTLEQYVRTFLRMPSVGTFIIVSRDADFQDAKRMVEYHGVSNPRKCIFVYYDNSTGEVRSEDGEVIRLSVKPQLNGAYRNGLDVNKFSCIISGIENGFMAYDPTDSTHKFIAAVVKVLKARSGELEELHKPFMGLRDSVWADVSGKFRSEFSREDAQDLLTALKDSDVLQANQDGRFKYYTFNDRCSFLATLTKLQVLQ